MNNATLRWNSFIIVSTILLFVFVLLPYEIHTVRTVLRTVQSFANNIFNDPTSSPPPSKAVARNVFLSFLLLLPCPVNFNRRTSSQNYSIRCWSTKRIHSAGPAGGHHREDDIVAQPLQVGNWMLRRGSERIHKNWLLSINLISLSKSLSDPPWTVAG